MAFQHSQTQTPSVSPLSWLWPGFEGSLGYRVHQDHQVQAQRNLYVQVARQTAINLTTIDYAEVDADIKRVLDSATGAFHDEFQNRSKPFVEVVKKVQSKSEGTIAEAGLLTYTKDQAQVLVAVAVKTSMAAAPPIKSPAGGGCVLPSIRLGTPPRCRMWSSCREQPNRINHAGGGLRDVR